MAVTELGMSTSGRAMSPEKALAPMVRTEFPMVTEVREVHPLKAWDPM